MTIRTLYAFVLVAFTGAGATASANLLTNGDFESQPNWGNGVSGDAGYTLNTGNQIPGWTIEAGHGATVHNTVLYPFISGSYSINMDGEGYNGKNADLYQDITPSIGSGLKLEFDWITWIGNATPLLDVSITDTVTSAVLAHGSYGYSNTLHHETFNFIATGNTLRLRVKEAQYTGFNDNTFIVDNFAITAVPEPGTLLAIGAGLAIIGLRRRR